MRRNQLSDFKEVQHLASLTKLEACYRFYSSTFNFSSIKKRMQVLWLHDNPISSDPNYRSKVIGLLPQVKKLDNLSK